MAHMVLIGGTKYAVKKGRTLIDGTGRDVKKGLTLIGGTAYEVKFSAALKWYLNANITLPVKAMYADFSVTESVFGATTNCTAITSGFDASSNQDALLYLYDRSGTEADITAYYTTDKRWGDSGYRTLTFAEPPEGELLEWLSANGTPQK